MHDRLISEVKTHERRILELLEKENPVPEEQVELEGLNSAWADLNEALAIRAKRLELSLIAEKYLVEVV